PVIGLSSMTDDVSCDDAVDTGSGQITISNSATDYYFRWWVGTDTLATTTEITNTGNTLGGTIDVNGDSTQIFDLPSGTYTVVAYDRNDPYAGCKSLATYTISEDNATISIATSFIAVEDNNNCAGPGNGTITVNGFSVDGTTITDQTGYTFTWLNEDNSAFAGTITADNATLTNAANNKIEALDADTYKVVIANTTTTCTTDTVEVTVGNDTSNPVINLSSMTDDTFCSGVVDTGDGQITISNSSTDYYFRWWVATDTTSDDNEITHTSNTLGGTITTNGDSTQISGLPSGTYTVVAYDRNDPYRGCQSLATYTISEDNNVYEIRRADIEVSNNTQCTGTSNGQIKINRVYRNGVAIEMNALGADTVDFTWTGIGAGNITSAGGFNLEDSAHSLAAGTYTVSLISTGNDACSSASINIVIEDDTSNPIIDITSLTNSTLCDPAADTGTGGVTVQIDGGADRNDYNITWYVNNTNAGSELFNAQRGSEDSTTSILTLDSLSASRTYYVVVENKADGCSATRSISIDEVPTYPNFDIDGDNIVDNTNCTYPNGSFSLSASEIISPSGKTMAHFTWNVYDEDGLFASDVDVSSGELSMTNLSAGKYYVEATYDTTGCTSARVEVEILDDTNGPVIDLMDITEDYTCGGSIAYGSIELLTIDGAAATETGYTYAWYVGTDTTAASGTRVNTVTGASEDNTMISGVVGDQTYSVVITNTTTGCIRYQSVTLESDPEEPILEFFEVNKNLICSSPTGEDGSGSFGITQIRYQGNIYTVADDSATIDSAFVFEYYAADQSTVVNDDYASTPFVLDSLPAGTYYAQVRHINSNCASGMVEFEIEDNQLYPEVFIEMVEADSSCNPINASGMLVATADGQDDSYDGFTFNWYEYDSLTDTRGDFITTNDTLDNRLAGSYQVEIVNTQTNCASTGEFTIPNVPIEPRITDYEVSQATNCNPANGIIEIIEMSSQTLADYRYMFYVGDPTEGGTLVQDSTLSSYSSAEPGVTYFVVAQHADYGCESTLLQVDMSDEFVTYPVINLDFNTLGSASKNQTSCDPDRPTGRIVVTVDGGQPDSLYTFTWSNGATTSTADSLSAGTYTVEVALNSSGCSSTRTFNVVDDIRTPLVINASSASNTNCANPNGQVAASVLDVADNPEYRGTNYTYYWFDGEVTSPDLTQADYVGEIIDGLPGGMYTVVAVDNVLDCFTSEPTVVEVEDESSTPELIINPDDITHLTICDPERADGHVVITDPADNLFRYSVDWVVGTDTTGVTPFDNGIFADSLTAGQYTAIVTDIITGCKQLIPFEIEDQTPIIPEPSINVIGHRNNCDFANGHAVVNVAGETEGYRFEWFRADDPNMNVVTTGSEVFVLDTTEYVVVATHIESGCQSPETTVKIINGIEDPVFTIQVTNSLCLRTEDGAVNQFSGQAFVNFSEYHHIDSISWVNARGFEVSDDITLIDAAPGLYSVYFQSDNGCEYSAEFEVTAAVKIYNGVSANEDGLNDFFLIDCIDRFPENVITIYNRTGTRVYEAKGYDNRNIYFDGFSNVGAAGKKLPVGTYFYIIDRGDGSDLIQGYLELVR
ncbi:MAG: gliding motility-associated C-terminal domain-containing protein, partial [Cyclobacteriaceae bacterium]